MLLPLDTTPAAAEAQEEAYRRMGEAGRLHAAQERAVDVPYPEAVAGARAHFAGKRWLLLLNVEMPDPQAQGFRLIAQTREPVFEKTDERYWLYAPAE